MNTAAELDAKLNEMILAGKALDAFEELYGDDVVMQENAEAPTAGKEANRKRELEFFGSVEEFHGAKMHGSAVNGSRSYSDWEYDITFRGGGRVLMSQAVVREWKDGKVVFERFYYSK